MASAEIHFDQAHHNEDLANFLLQNPQPPKFLDWAITAAFYAAIHYVETVFFFTPDVLHTEQSVPIEPSSGRMRFTHHVWREKLIQQKMTQPEWTAFRKLKTHSEIVRYLSHKSLGVPGYATKPGRTYYNATDVNLFVRRDLKAVKGSVLGISKAAVFEILWDAYSRVGKTPFMPLILQVIAYYPSRQSLLTDKTLAKRLSGEDEKALTELMVKAGHWTADPPAAAQIASPQ